MKKFILMALLGCAMNSYAQQFQHKFDIIMPDSVAEASMEWVDMDNDSLLDVLVVATNTLGEQFLLTYKNDRATGFHWKSSMLTGFEDAVYQLEDVDLDNQIDIVISGQSSGNGSTIVFSNTGNFTFQKAPQPLVSTFGALFRFSDLDQDGRKDFLLTHEQGGKSYTSIYRQASGSWVKVCDSLVVYQSLNNDVDTLNLIATDIIPLDFDGDMDNDLFVSGTFYDGSLFNGVIFNLGNYKFKTRATLSSVKNGRSAAGDINHDGGFDILLSGKNPSGPDSMVIFKNNGTSIIRDSGIALNDNKIFIADFNADGKADINYLGTTAPGDTLNLIFSNNDFDTLNSGKLVSQQFGDFDHDGDLDLLQNISNNRFELWENKIAAVNLPPGKPSNPFAVNIFNRLFIFWEKPADDHTPVPAITYDLTLQGSNVDLITGNFDQVNFNRLVVRHGNQLTNHFNLFRNIPLGGHNFSIQAIDNAFHGDANGICNGSSGECAVTVQRIPSCMNEKISLGTDEERLWFSFSKGFLGSYDIFPHTVMSTDTLFSVPMHNATCTSVNAYIFDVKENYNKISNTILTVCEGAQLVLSSEMDWPQVTWESSEKGFISNNPTIDYHVQGADTVKVKITTGTSCNIQRNNIIRISKPEIALNGKIFKILKGEQVSIVATADDKSTYDWEPSTGLNTTDAANPIASPGITTEYTVTVTDTVNCQASEKVLVVVENMAFIPNLFTPNGDGKNDDVKVYGISSVKNFSFTIHTREGAIVYQTKNIGDATGSGWDGTVNSVQQPAGVYYWKVKGEMSNGNKILLNGKSTGSIVLIR
jgi:gliding motility-associated-like protein